MNGRRFKISQCFEILGLSKPKIKGADQLEVDTRLQEWKDSVLKSHFRKKAQEVHPDKNPEDPEAGQKFKDLKDAYEQVKEDLKIRLNKPNNICPGCSTLRTPKEASYCWHCGYCYNIDPIESRLRSAGLTQETINACRWDGTLERLKLLPPYSHELDLQIQILRLRQKPNIF